MSCNAKKDPNGTWRIQYRWTDWTGTKKKSQKRGFKTKKEAEEWYAHFMLQQSSDPTMTLADFWEIYKADMEKRLRKTTMKQKEYVMNDKVLPYFGKMPINEITAPMIRKWQGEMMEKGFKPTYLKTIHNQLSAILNYAVNFYDLRSNPCRKAGSMGKSKADERPYWTLEEFQKFSDAIMDKQDSWIAFQILFWTGMRIGELLALQVKDIDFAQGTITVDESLTRLDGEDLITAPKTESSVRVITIHKELQEELYTHIDAKGGLLVLKQAPTPEEIVKLGVEGIIKIWKDAKLRGNGHKKAMQILNAAMRSIGLKIGLREARMEIQDLIEDYELQTKRLERINDLIKELCQQIKYANKLLEIKGIGITTVGGFIAEVGDITRFDNTKELQKLAGLELVADSSGKHNGKTKISKRGRKRLRYLLFEAAISVVGKNEEFKEIHRYYITREKNPLKKMQSLIAVACKLIRVFHVILTKGIRYDASKMLGDIKRPGTQQKAA